MHLHRAKYIPKGGPDGGDGGRGGHIILKANPQYWTLIHLKYRQHIKADDGEKGGAALCRGKNGEDIYLDVPVGTVVKDAESGEVLFEMMEAGEERILCKGGRGGWVTTTSRSPPNRRRATPSRAKKGRRECSSWSSNCWPM